MTALNRERRIRRPRMTPNREHEVLISALETLAEVGYEALSMDLVAARARCSKATLYRLWNTKQTLVVAALQASAPVDLALIDSGTLRADLVIMVEHLARHAVVDAALVASIHHATLIDPDLATALRETIVDPEASLIAGMVARALKRGEIASEPAAGPFLPLLLLGAVVLRPTFTGTPADEEHLLNFVDAVLMPALLHS